MEKNTKNLAVDAALSMFPAALLAKKLFDLASNAVDNDKDTSSITTPNLREQAERHELEQRIKQSNAKIAQEYAITARIYTADEVEMEEVYEYSRSGSGGIQANVTAGDFGLNGSGEVRRVSKRIYRFKGGLQIDALPDQQALTVVP